MTDNHDDSAEGDNLYSLFVCEDYVTKTWAFGEETQDLLCSNMSSTDFDLTGQIVWPASLLLSWFIHGNAESHFRGKKVLELGAGCGLAGFFAARFAESVMITDGNNIVMKLLEQNQTFLNYPNTNVQKLLWGRVSELQALFPVPESYPEVIIGADIILWPSQIQNLLTTLHFLLFSRLQAGLSPGVVFISYIVRATSTSDLLYTHAKQLHLELDSIATTSFVPETCHTFDTLEKHLFRITLDPIATAARQEEFTRLYSDSEAYAVAQLATETMPC